MVQVPRTFPSNALSLLAWKRIKSQGRQFWCYTFPLLLYLVEAYGFPVPVVPCLPGTGCGVIRVFAKLMNDVNCKFMILHSNCHDIRSRNKPVKPVLFHRFWHCNRCAVKVSGKVAYIVAPDLEIYNCQMGKCVVVSFVSTIESSIPRGPVFRPIT